MPVRRVTEEEMPAPTIIELATEPVISDDRESCHFCEEYFDDGELSQRDGEMICDDCVCEHYTDCNDCSESFSNVDLEDGYCESCHQNNYFNCNDCGDSAHIDDMRLEEGEYYCSSCYGDHLIMCDMCEESSFDANMTIERDDDNDETRNVCPSCVENKNIPINNYSYKPKPEFKSEINNNVDTLFCGFELEIEGTRECDHKVVAKDIIDYSKNWLYCKRDGSLRDGFEIISHPASFQWMKNHSKIIKKMLSVKKLGYRSFQTTTCGMHIHLSKKCFGTIHLLKFLRFVYENEDFILKISQRKYEDLHKWASTHINNDFSNKERAKSKNNLNFNRKTAVNLQPEKTVELRIFKGTLNYSSFMKNIEFAFCLYEFTKGTELNRVSVRDFTKYLEKNKQFYPNLFNFVEDFDS